MFVSVPVSDTPKCLRASGLSTLQVTSGVPLTENITLYFHSDVHQNRVGTSERPTLLSVSEPLRFLGSGITCRFKQDIYIYRLLLPPEEGDDSNTLSTIF